MPYYSSEKNINIIIIVVWIVSCTLQRLWEGHIEENGVSFSYTSPDGENSYPGEVFVTINYQLTDDNKILISYVAKTTKATPVNLTNHSYFNLGGHVSFACLLFFGGGGVMFFVKMFLHSGIGEDLLNSHPSCQLKFESEDSLHFLVKRCFIEIPIP